MSQEDALGLSGHKVSYKNYKKDLWGKRQESGEGRKELEEGCSREGGRHTNGGG